MRHPGGQHVFCRELTARFFHLSHTRHHQVLFRLSCKHLSKDGYGGCVVRVHHAVRCDPYVHNVPADTRVSPLKTGAAGVISEMDAGRQPSMACQPRSRCESVTNADMVAAIIKCGSSHRDVQNLYIRTSLQHRGRAPTWSSRCDHGGLFGTSHRRIRAPTAHPSSNS